jgi:hypothetical protein
MKIDRVYSSELACEIGLNESLVVGQLHYWSKKPNIGVVIDGVKYVRNTIDQWRSKENFPFWSKDTIYRTFKRLVDLGIVLVKKLKKSGWDHTISYGLDYSHPLLQSAENDCRNLRKPITANCGNRIPQSATFFNTYNTSEKTTEKTYRDPSVSFSSKEESTSKPTVLANRELERAPNPCNQLYREQYKEASPWLDNQGEEFRRQAKEYCEYHCNGPTVKYPVAYKMSIIVEIWKKYTDKDHHTDFHYVDKEVLRQVEGIEIECRKKKAIDGFEAEMMRLYETGEINEQIA